MGQVLVRNIDDMVHEQLRQRAKRHGHRLEQELRDILRTAAAEEIPASKVLGTRIASLFADIGLEDGEELERLPPEPVRPAIFEP